MSTKQCTKCNEIKELTQFYKNKTHKDRLSSICKICMDRSVKEYQQTPKGRAVKLKTQAKYRKTEQAHINQRKSDKKRRQKPEVKAIEKQRRKVYMSTPKAKEMKSKSAKKSLENPENWARYLARGARWAKNNPGKVNAQTAKRWTAKLKRTLSWLTKQQLEEIKEFYVLAHELQWLSEEVLHVDHIVPLQGENVSGLHVPWNLQILPQTLNTSKGNSFDAKAYDALNLPLLIKQISQIEPIEDELVA